jgi:hypothetical protein
MGWKRVNDFFFFRDPDDGSEPFPRDSQIKAILYRAIINSHIVAEQWEVWYHDS